MSRLRYEQCPKCAERGGDSRRDNLVCYPDNGAHCFSCGYHRPANYLGPTKHFRELKATYGSACLPADFTYDVEPAAWRWLLQYGLPYSYWQSQGVGYSPSTGRLVFPCPAESPIFSIGRFIDGVETPEGGFPNTYKWKTWGESHSDAVVISPSSSSAGIGERAPLGTVMVVVEDLLSAHKTGQIAASMPLFGTTLHPCHFKAILGASMALLGGISEVVLWLDWDQRGLTAKKAARINLITGLPVRIVHTRDDPKLLSLKEIYETLC